MRILMLTTSYPKYPGEATAPFIEEIAAGVAARGHTVHVLLPWHPDVQRNSLERGVRLHFFRYAPHPVLNVWGYAQSLHADTSLKWQTLVVLPFALAQTITACTRLLRTLPPFDLFHAHWVLPNGVPALLAARAHHLPILISLHGSDIYLAEQFPMTAPAAGAAFRGVDAVSACSTDLSRRGIRLGARPDTMHIIPYGVHPHEFRPDDTARMHLTTWIPLRDDGPLVVGVGRLVRKKGFHVLLDAWPLVLQQLPNALLVLVGDGDLQQELEQQATRLGIRQHVYFTGRLDRRRTATCIAAADVFALPIIRDQGMDGLPNTLLEAMGAARAIVASCVAGVPDVVEHERHGLLVPDQDAPACAAALLRLLSDRALAERLGRAARQRIETELTWAQTAARFERVYEEVLGRGNRPR